MNDQPDSDRTPLPYVVHVIPSSDTKFAYDDEPVTLRDEQSPLTREILDVCDRHFRESSF
jgi:hypothetical protein